MRVCRINPRYILKPVGGDLEVNENRGMAMVRRPVSAASVVCAVPGQVSSRLSDEVVILNLDKGTYHGLEVVGARIWELIQKPMAVREVRDVLLNEYDAEPQRCENDLLALLEELQSHDLLEVQPADR